MWSVYNWLYGIEDNKPEITGPARYIPLTDMLQKQKLSLKSPDIVNKLNSMSQLTEAMLVRKKLRHVKTRPRQTVWKNENPLFDELKEYVNRKFQNRIC